MTRLDERPTTTCDGKVRLGYVESIYIHVYSHDVISFVDSCGFSSVEATLFTRGFRMYFRDSLIIAKRMMTYVSSAKSCSINI